MGTPTARRTSLGRPIVRCSAAPRIVACRGTATELWSVDFDDVVNHRVEVIGRDLVVVAIERPGTAGSQESNAELLALDALTGAQRWTLPLSAGPSEVAVVGSVDDLLLVEQPGDPGPTVIGVDMATGETRWSTTAQPNVGHVGLIGTRFVARLPSPPDRFVSLIDASSGNEVGEIASDPTADGRPGGWITDGRGTWYSIVDGEVLALDLTSELASPTTVGELDVGPVTPVVVGDRLVAVDDAGSIVLVGPDGRRSATGSSVPSPARSLTPVSGSDFVVTTPGAIAGVAVDGDAVTVAWQRAGGAEVGYHPIEGGTLLQVATRGGAAMELVDAASGDTVEQLVMVPGALQALVVAGDGIRRAASRRARHESRRCRLRRHRAMVDPRRGTGDRRRPGRRARRVGCGRASPDDLRRRRMTRHRSGRMAR